MTTSTALHLAAAMRPGSPSPVPVLASRPRGVVHVVEVADPGRRVVPPDRRPVCGRSHRRLYVVPDRPSPQLVGHLQNGQRLCHRCLAHLARASEGSRAGWAPQLTARATMHRNELVTGHIAGGEPFDVVVDGQVAGLIARGSNDQWHVHSAGEGVPVHKGLRGPRSVDAIRVLAIARELARLPGGALELLDGLTRMDRAILDFAGRTFSSNGRRDRAITAELGLTPLRFHQRLNALIDLHAAERYAPTTVHRRRRLRHHHRRRRTLATLAPTPMPEGVST